MAQWCLQMLSSVPYWWGASLTTHSMVWEWEVFDSSVCTGLRWHFVTFVICSLLVPLHRADIHKTKSFNYYYYWKKNKAESFSVTLVTQQRHSQNQNQLFWPSMCTHTRNLTQSFFPLLSMYTGIDKTAESKDNKAEQIKIKNRQDYFSSHRFNSLNVLNWEVHFSLATIMKIPRISFNEGNLGF